MFTPTRNTSRWTRILLCATSLTFATQTHTIKWPRIMMRIALLYLASYTDIVRDYVATPLDNHLKLQQFDQCVDHCEQTPVCCENAHTMSSCRFKAALRKRDGCMQSCCRGKRDPQYYKQHRARCTPPLHETHPRNVSFLLVGATQCDELHPDLNGFDYCLEKFKEMRGATCYELTTQTTSLGLMCMDITDVLGEYTAEHSQKKLNPIAIPDELF